MRITASQRTLRRYQRGFTTTLAVSGEVFQTASSEHSAPHWATGYIQKTDLAFLCDLISREKVKTMIEIGVASGVSTVSLYNYLRNINGNSRLFSFDIMEHYYADKFRRLGQYVYERFGSVPEGLFLYPGVGSHQIHSRLSDNVVADCAFVDGDHRHPWPALDVLCLLRALKPGGWIALHDIFLPILNSKFPVYGAYHLFQAWPGERTHLAADDKVAKDEINIGAIKTFDSIDDTLDAILEILCVPWEEEIPGPVREAILEFVGRLSPKKVAKLAAVLYAQSEAAKPVTIDRMEVSSPNPWFKLDGLPATDKIIIHANTPEQSPASITFKSISVKNASYIVLPALRASGACSGPINVIAKTCSGSSNLISKSMRGSRDHRAEACITSGFIVPMFIEVVGKNEIDLTIQLTLDLGKPSLNGAWIEVGPIFVAG